MVNSAFSVQRQCPPGQIPDCSTQKKILAIDAIASARIINRPAVTAITMPAVNTTQSAVTAPSSRARNALTLCNIPIPIKIRSVGKVQFR